MSNTLNLFCLNCRGLRERHKRQAAFTFLKNKGSGIFLLQETYSDINGEPMWNNEWESNIFFSDGQPNSRGVAVLVSRDIDLTINNCDKDEFGRYLLINCEIKNNRYILVNLYAPTIDKIAEQKIFGEYISNKLQQYIGENVVIGGDLNIDLDCAFKEPNNLKNLVYGRQIVSLMESLSLSDIWRLKNPTRKRYTRREKTRYGFSQSRLDYFFMSCHLEYYTKNTDIMPSIKSDHSLLSLEISLADEPKGVQEHGS